MGYKAWYNDETGELHREGGPALIYPDGEEQWFSNGETHREGGPALTDSYGDDIWYWHGTQMSEEEYKEM